MPRVLVDDDAVEALAQTLAEIVIERLMINGQTDCWLTTAEAATHLGITTNGLHKLASEGRVPFAQEGPNCRLYFQRSELDRWRGRQVSPIVR